MTNLISGIALATNILATNHVEFQTNVTHRNHPDNTLWIFNSDKSKPDSALVPFVSIWETNITRIDTLEYTWQGRRVILESVPTKILSTQVVFRVKLSGWERVP